MDPIRLFLDWYQSARDSDRTGFPGAVCVSTVDENGSPNSRFVDLKEVRDGEFVFCTHLDSAKAQEIRHNPEVSLAFWWPQSERQVRVVGSASHISGPDAERLFQQRSREAQLATLASRQSADTDDPSHVRAKVKELETELFGKQIQRPLGWGGYRVKPAKIEFMEFRSNRLHERQLFRLNGTEWNRQWLQP